METNIDARLQEAFGQILAANAAIAALCATHQNKLALLAELRTFDSLSMDLLRKTEQRHPGLGQTMQEAYLQQLSAFRQLLGQH